MANTCSWCGKAIGFFDMNYTYEIVDDKEHFICGECCKKVSAAKAGSTTFDEIKTPQTEPELFRYFTNRTVSSEEAQQAAKAQQMKNDARKTDPLYDDIHQIAGDLRFIKNYLIFCIVAGIILGFIALVALL